VNLLKSPLRRSAAIVAGALVGLAGAVAIAAPASAHHPTVTPQSACVNPDGTWQVTWAVANSETDLTATLDWVNIEPADRSTITNIVADATLPVKDDGPLIGVQTLNKFVLIARLTVQGHWVRNGEDIVKVDTGWIRRPQEKCAPETPSPSPSTPTPTPSESTPTPEPSESTPTPPETSPTPSPSESTPAEAQWVYDETCDTLTVGVDVPADWDALTVTFTPSTGEAKTVTAPPGKETVVDFPASAGLKVVASAKGYEDEAATITYKKPANCDTAGNGGGGSLPVTGAAAGGIAAGAAALLAIGGALFFMARRRKVKFTA
jgi:LPXTG-motif cell wall-anchored protein